MIVEELKKDYLERIDSLINTDISNKIKKSLKEFCGSAKQHDDQTLLVIKIQ